MENESSKELTWSVHPLRRNYLVSAAVILFLSLVLLLVYLAMHSWLMVIVATLLLLGALTSFFFPTSYRLTEEYIVIKKPFSVQTRKLREFNRIVPGKNMIFLSPFAQPSRLDAFRGIYLYTDGATERVLRFVKNYLSDARDVQKKEEK